MCHSIGIFIFIFVLKKETMRVRQAAFRFDRITERRPYSRTFKIDHTFVDESAGRLVCHHGENSQRTKYAHAHVRQEIFQVNSGYISEFGYELRRNEQRANGQIFELGREDSDG